MTRREMVKRSLAAAAAVIAAPAVAWAGSRVSGRGALVRGEFDLDIEREDIREAVGRHTRDLVRRSTEDRIGRRPKVHFRGGAYSHDMMPERVLWRDHYLVEGVERSYRVDTIVLRSAFVDRTGQLIAAGTPAIEITVCL